MRRRILNTMKRLEVVLERDQLSAACKILSAHSTGYTVIPEITGYGHHGHRENDIVLVVTIVTKDHIDPIIDLMMPLVEERSGVILVTDVQVLRGEYFVPELRHRHDRLEKLDHGVAL